MKSFSSSFIYTRLHMTENEVMKADLQIIIKVQQLVSEFPSSVIDAMCE